MSLPHQPNTHDHHTPTEGPMLTTEQGHQFQVPVEGSLGLLALGYVGLMSWRQAKYNAAHQMIDSYSSSVNNSNT